MYVNIVNNTKTVQAYLPDHWPLLVFNTVMEVWIGARLWYVALCPVLALITSIASLRVLAHLLADMSPPAVILSGRSQAVDAVPVPSAVTDIVFTHTHYVSHPFSSSGAPKLDSHVAP